MMRQSTTALLIIVLQAGLFWFLAEGVVFPIVVCLISLPAVLHQRRWEMSSQTLPLVDLGLAGICTMQWYLAPCELRRISPFVMYPLVHAAAQFFLLVQVARLWGRRPDRMQPVYFPMLAILVFICLGDIDTTPRQHRWYRDAAMLLVGLTCLFYGQARRIEISAVTKSSRWLRLAISVGVLVVAAISIRECNVLLRQKWESIEKWLGQVSTARSRPNRRDVFAGFSGSASLDSVRFLKSSLNQDVALRIQSEDAPGYLRGAVFERLIDRSWEWNPRWQPVSQMRKAEIAATSDKSAAVRQPAATRPRLVLRPAAGRKLHPMTIWRENAVERFTFLPLTTSHVELKVNEMPIDRHGVISGDSLPGDLPMTAWVSDLDFTPESPEPLVQPTNWDGQRPFCLTNAEHAEAVFHLLQLPHGLSPDVVEIARKIFSDCETPESKLHAVKRYFSSYRYAPGIKIPPGRDPLTYFLTARPPAHCEMFASGAAVLLRLGGIPCRYVTGYAGAEHNSVGNYWIVRQADAHAWVEAYLPDRGWTIVEATPSDGLPSTSESLKPWHLWDEINLRGQMIRAALSSNTWQGTLTAIHLFGMTLLSTIPGWLLSGGVLFLLVRQIPWRRRARTRIVDSATVLDLRLLLEQVESRLRRFQLQRESHETLHRFAERLRSESAARPGLLQVADWYHMYAATRYRDDSTVAETDNLRQQLEAVCQQLAKPKLGSVRTAKHSPLLTDTFANE